MNSEPVKYEVDKESGAIFVDRLLTTPMRYPCNYGYVPHILCGDRDPLDVLVMTDEGGTDEKLIAFPSDKVGPLYKDVETVRALPSLIRDQSQHFFEHYKDLEKGKWVKVEGWHGPKDAKQAILDSP